jgi:hypothetical protein
MAATKPYITINSEWVNVYALAGLPVGAPIYIENIGAYTAELHVGESAPAPRSANVGANSLYPLATKGMRGGNLGLWARVKADTKATRLQVDFTTGIVDGTLVPIDQTTTLFMRFDDIVQAAGTNDFVLLSNRTSSPITIEQLINFESYSTDATEGQSLVELTFYFNINLTGAFIGVSSGRAYTNDVNGNFEDVTLTAMQIDLLTGFNTALNPDKLKIVGGSVGFTTLNGLVRFVDDHITLKRKITLPAGSEFVIGIENKALIGGVNSQTSALLSGRYLFENETILPPATADFNDEFTNDFS